MYMLAAFLTSLSVYFFISAIKDNNLFFLTGFIFSTVLMLYTDYLPYLILPVFIVYLFLNKKRIERSVLKSFIPAFILILIFILPWLFVFSKQFALGLSVKTVSPAWAHILGRPDLNSLLITFVKFIIGRISYDNNLIYALLFTPIGIFYLLTFTLSLLRFSRERSILWLWVFLPVTVAFIISFFVPVFAYFRLIFVLSSFYLIWAVAINIINWPLLVRVLLTISLVINLTASIIYFTNSKFQREDWRTATNYVVANSTSETVVFFESDYTIAPFDYYSQNKVKAFGVLDSYNPKTNQIHQKIEGLTKGINKIFLFQYLSAITDQQGIAFEEITKLGFVNTKTQNFEGVGFIYEFER